jgi:hypothetical protein
MLASTVDLSNSAVLTEIPCGRGGTVESAFQNYRKSEQEVETKQLEMFWIKTNGLYPSYDDADDSIGKHDPHSSAEYGVAQHDLMKHIFESSCDEQAMKEAAAIVGANGNVHAMHGCFYSFMHAAGMAYQKSGMEGRAASIALGRIRFKLTESWDGVNGFSLYNQGNWSEA